jgi:hypothetical protein
MSAPVTVGNSLGYHRPQGIVSQYAPSAGIFVRAVLFTARRLDSNQTAGLASSSKARSSPQALPQSPIS